MGVLRKLAGDESGAASVLVVFIMIVLVTLGAFAIASAGANYRFSLRAQEWNKMYYSLDSMGEEFIAAVDAKLMEAESAAASEMADNYGSVSNAFQEDVFCKLYMNYADIYFNRMAAEFPGLEVYPSYNGESIGSIYLIMIIKPEEPDYIGRGLYISVLVEPGADEKPHYSIEEWYEYQGPAGSEGEEQPQELWDGIIE